MSLASYYSADFLWAWDTIWAFAWSRILWSIPIAMIGAIFSAYKARRTGHNWGETLIQSAIVAIAAPVILIGIGLLVNIVRYPPFHESEHVQQNERLVSKNESLSQQISSRDKKGLLIDCYAGQVPREMPPTGRLYFVYLFSSKQFINMSYSFGAPGSAVDLKTSPFNSVQCMITNYASDVLLGLELPVTVDFLKTTKNDSGGYDTKGAVDERKDALIYINRIDNGSEKPFVFYFINLGPEFINFGFPTSANSQHLDSHEKIVVPVFFNSPISISISPHLEITK